MRRHEVVRSIDASRIDDYDARRRTQASAAQLAAAGAWPPSSGHASGRTIQYARDIISLRKGPRRGYRIKTRRRAAAAGVYSSLDARSTVRATCLQPACLRTPQREDAAPKSPEARFVASCSSHRAVAGGRANAVATSAPR